MTKVSIIIPTYNRPSYLRRVLDYYDGYKINYKIIIADSSSDENKEQNKKSIKHFPDLNILHLSAYPMNINPRHKMFHALSHIKSRYCVICAEDDFIVPSAIKKSVLFMEKNPDYSVVIGFYCSHWLIKGKKGKIEFRWVPDYYPSKSLTFDNPSERLKFHLSNYNVVTFYGVHRTNLLRFIFGEVKETTLHGRLGEILLTALTLIYGKMGILSIFYSSRENGSTSIESLNILPYFHLTWSPFFVHRNFNAEYKRAIACLARNLQKQTNLNPDLSTKLAEEALNGYLNSLHRTPLQKIRSRLFNLLSKTLPGAHLRNIRLRGVKREYSDFLEKNDSKFHENLNRIRKAVTASKVYIIK